MDQRTIMSLLRRASLPAAICLIVLVGMLGVFGFLRPTHSAHADPPTFHNVPGNQTSTESGGPDTFVFKYGPITVTDDDGDNAFTCVANNGATSSSGFVSDGTFHLGTTTVTCHAPDEPENPLDDSTVSFTVTVNDNPLSFSNVPGPITVDSQSAAGAVITYTKPTATETGESEVIPVVCLPASGSVFVIGLNYITCTATDPDGKGTNTITTSIPVNVVEAAPVFDNLPASQTLTVPANSPDDKVAFIFPTVTATEAGEPAGSPAEVINVTCTITSGTRLAGSAAGTVYPESCTAVDTDGLTTKGNFTLTVVDNSPPTVTITPPGPISVNATSPAGAVVTFSASASELGEPPLTPTCTPASGSTFPINPVGQFTTVTCTATDTDPATGSATLLVHVKGAVEQLNDLCNQFPTLTFSDEGTFCSQLRVVITELQSGQTNQACFALTLITAEVSITHNQAILTALTRIQNVIGCPSKPAVTPF